VGKARSVKSKQPSVSRVKFSFQILIKEIVRKSNAETEKSITLFQNIEQQYQNVSHLHYEVPLKFSKAIPINLSYIVNFHA
jgi:hypothetical protein